MSFDFATGSITTDNTEVADDATIAIGGKTYTIKASGASADGEVNKGANADATLDNLMAAINLSTNGGKYGASMTQNPYVTATGRSGHVLSLKSRVPGAIGNLIAIGAAPTHWTRSGANFTGGAGSLDTEIAALRAAYQISAAANQALIEMTPAGASA